MRRGMAANPFSPGGEEGFLFSVGPSDGSRFKVNGSRF